MQLIFKQQTKTRRGKGGGEREVGGVILSQALWNQKKLIKERQKKNKEEEK